MSQAVSRTPQVMAQHFRLSTQQITTVSRVRLIIGCELCTYMDKFLVSVRKVGCAERAAKTDAAADETSQDCALESLNKATCL